METLAQKCRRVLGSLEDLATQEAACRAMGDLDSVTALQRRTAPLVAFLGEHGPALADDTMRERLEAWLAGRRETEDWLAGRITDTRARLSEIEGARGRIAQVGPAYGRRSGDVRRQFAANG